MKLFAIEGNSLRLDGGSMFGNAPKELWKQWLAPDDKNRIHLSTRALLIQTDDGRNVLMEAGAGAFFDPKMKERYGIVEQGHMLLKNLAAAGLSAEDIDVIILSHLHFDHAGGMLSAFEEGPLRLLFPNSRIYTGKAHWERACRPHVRDRASFVPQLNALLEASGRLVLIEGPTHPDLDFGRNFKLSFGYSQGHTVGLLVTRMEVEGSPLVYGADLIPGMPWMSLPISIGYDRFPELLIDEKKAVFDALLAQEGRIYFTHDPNIACAKVCQDPQGKYYGQPEKIG